MNISFKSIITLVLCTFACTVIAAPLAANKDTKTEDGDCGCGCGGKNKKKQ